ncbi:hypothetical protein ZOSMA_79G00510 [Zostera marina]|uniref:Uncharacterized protein n=1 Tax=Zostera marina TaxID=29655 RepID=A0A0K9NNM6_ZOSMR|nr:hypothetical protein ZOSMA_79G00510 [Zostera marina]
MTLLCFLLDLRTIPPSLLREIKQSLLQLANLYAISVWNEAEDRPFTPLQDRIGLCYLHRNMMLNSDEIKIAYSPWGNFNLRNFHHAVNNIPMDNYLLESGSVDSSRSNNLDVEFRKLLSHESLYPWNGKYALKKLIFISSYMITIDESLRKVIMEAAEQCIMVEFIMLEQDHYHDLPYRSELFLDSISDLENCVFRRYTPDFRVFCGLVKKWMQELNGEPVQAVFIFDGNIAGFKNKIYCSLNASSSPIVDGFHISQTCRCHGRPIESIISKTIKKLSCPVTNCNIEASEANRNAVEVGDNTLLFLPSSHDFLKKQKVPLLITFNISERINLSSLDEVFHGLRVSLSQMDQGLVCVSRFNTETMKTTIFQCYYVLQPSNCGPMLLRRLAALEEVLPIPVSMLSDMNVSDDTMVSIRASISNLKLTDYDPLMHVRGFHMKLNSLVNESLESGTIPEQAVFKSTDRTTFGSEDLVLSQSITKNCEVEMQTVDDKMNDNDDMSSITKEWEQLLVVDNVKDCRLSPSFSKYVTEKEEILTSQKKHIGEQTSRILERLEPPKQPKLVRTTPIIGSGVQKKPLLPINSQNNEQKKPLKPSFHRLKRK